MEQPAFFSATLGLSLPWEITSVSFSKDAKRLDIIIDFVPSSSFECPTCGSAGRSGTKVKETWFHDDFFRYATYLHARVPHCECGTCGTFTVTRPWSRDGSRFTLLGTE